MLRKLREQRGWTQGDLARKVRVTTAYICELETGRKKNPSLAVLRRLARALGASVSHLVE